MLSGEYCWRTQLTGVACFCNILSPNTSACMHTEAPGLKMSVLSPAMEEDASTAGLVQPPALDAPGAILAALGELEAEESRIDEDLSAMMADRAMLETLRDRIDSVRPVVEQVQLEAGELARRIDDTADVAERISGKVRQLDLEQVGIVLAAGHRTI